MYVPASISVIVAVPSEPVVTTIGCPSEPNTIFPSVSYKFTFEFGIGFPLVSTTFTSNFNLSFTISLSISSSVFTSSTLPSFVILNVIL